MSNNRTTHHRSLVMYALTLAHLTAAEHERDLEADLRQRRILKASDAVRRAVTADPANTNDAALGICDPSPRWVGSGQPGARTTAMPHDVISTCPVCSSELAVTRLHCRSCGTTLEGDFSVGRFGRLNREQLACSRASCAHAGTCARWSASSGSAIRPSDRASRRSSTPLASGRGPRARIRTTRRHEPTQDGRSREEILQALARHEMSADDAAAAIRALGRTPR